MEKIILTENGIQNLSNSLLSGQVDPNGITIQVSSTTHQITNNKKMYKCSINDQNYKMNAVFIHNENQDIENNDIIKIESIFVKPGTTSLVIIKKYTILAKQMHPIAKGHLEPYRSESSNNNSNNINNDSNNQINNDNKNIRNYNQKQFDEGYSNQNNLNNKDVNYNNYDMNNNNRSGLSNATRTGSNYLPLAVLSSFTKDILMKVRITKKFEKKTYGSGAKQGMVFSFNIIDEEGTEFPCCGFNKACENYYDKIAEGKVYEISGGYVKINDKKWSNIKSEYKFFLDDKTVINEIGDDETISNVNFNFKKLIDLVDLQLNSFVDLLAYVIKCNEVRQIKTKKGDERNMRKIILADDSGYKIEATIWGKLCQMTINEGTVYAFKSLKLGEYNKSKNLSIGDDSGIIEQDNKEALDLQLFCNEQDQDFFKDVPVLLGEANDPMTGYVHQNLKYIKEITDMLDKNANDDNNNDNKKFDSFKVKAVITGLTLNNDKFYYEGCPGCKKKMQANERDEYYCNSCAKNYDKSTLYYTLNIRIKDITGEIYVDILGNIGQKVFGKTAEEIKELLVKGNEDELKKIISGSDYAQYYFLILPKLHIYNDIKRKKFSVIKIDSVESVTETNRIVQVLSKYC